jgi:hypothetical protein
METQRLNPRFLTLLLIILAASLVRVLNAAQLGPMTNLTPIGAMALFGGAYFSKPWKAFLVALLSLLLSDLIINGVLFDGKYGLMYQGWMGVYAVFALIVVYGKQFLQKITVGNVLLAALIASLGHWILSDTMSYFSPLGLDLRTGQPFARTWDALLQCYAQGLPYMKNFLTGTLFYSALMFGGFELAKLRFPVLAIRQ